MNAVLLGSELQDCKKTFLDFTNENWVHRYTVLLDSEEEELKYFAK